MRKMRASGIKPIIEVRDRVKELRRVRASELLPNPKNWRRHPREQAAAFKGLLSEIGYAGALLARELPDGNLMLIDGHLRAETTPDTIVPVLVLDLDEDEADKLLLTYDPLGAMAQSDQAAMEALLATVRTEDKAIAAMLERVAGESAWQVVDQREIVDPPAQIDRAGELQAKWGTERGQTWQIGPHRLVCGDCREKTDVGRLWADGGPKIGMIWTDPPYGIDYAAKNAYLNRSDRGNRIQTPIENRGTRDVARVAHRQGETESQDRRRGCSCDGSIGRPAQRRNRWRLVCLRPAGE
jgi:hypothetical protein